MWELLISVLDALDMNKLESPYLCDLSSEFNKLWNNYDELHTWEYLKSEAEKFLLEWGNMFDDWTISERYLFGKGGIENMPYVPKSEKVLVRLAFCKYMLNKSKEYELHQTKG